MKFDSLTIERDGHVALLWLNRPEKLNALHRALWASIPAAVAHLDAEPLPLVSLAVLIWALLRWRRVPSGSSEPRAGLVLAAAAAAMSLALTLKMFLFPRVWHYGFVLGMPAAMLAVAALLRAGSSWTRGAGGSPVIAGGVLAGVLAGAIAGHLRLMSETIALRIHPVGRGSDAFHTDARGVVVEEALEAIDRIAPAGATLAALPDGVLLNYLARRPNSPPYGIGNPVDGAIFEEERMLEAYREAPPDFIVMIVCDTMIYGVPGFGRGYAERLDAWIEANYEVIGIAGTGQAPDNPFRAVVLRRRGSSR